MPVEDCPSFHCLPSTARTFFPPSLSIRQMPTTATSDFGSAPTVSLEKSILVGCCAAAGSTNRAKPRAETVTALMLLLMFMAMPPFGAYGSRLGDGGSTTNRARYRAEAHQKTREERPLRG